jgi:hypothetical protein
LTSTTMTYATATRRFLRLIIYLLLSTHRYSLTAFYAAVPSCCCLHLAIHTMPPASTKPHHRLSRSLSHKAAPQAATSLTTTYICQSFPATASLTTDPPATASLTTVSDYRLPPASASSQLLLRILLRQPPLEATAPLATAPVPPLL